MKIQNDFTLTQILYQQHPEITEEKDQEDFITRYQKELLKQIIQNELIDCMG